MRLFIAVDISDEARSAAAAHIAELRRRYLGVKVSWVRPENLHITVKFLGETPKDKIDGIKEALAAAAAAIRPFEIQLSKPGSFGKKVLFINTADEGGALKAVHGRVEAALDPLGFDRENREFRPHITIARIRDPRGATPMIATHNAGHLPRVRMHAGGVTLYESSLGHGGSRYTMLERFPFRG